MPLASESYLLLTHLKIKSIIYMETTHTYIHICTHIYKNTYTHIYVYTYMEYMDKLEMIGYIERKNSSKSQLQMRPEKSLAHS